VCVCVCARARARRVLAHGWVSRAYILFPPPLLHEGHYYTAQSSMGDSTPVWGTDPHPASRPPGTSHTTDDSASRYSISILFLLGVRGSVVGWGIMLQAGRSRVRFPMSLDFSIHLILPAGAWGWQPRRHLWADCLENVSFDVSQPYGSSWPATGIAAPFTSLNRGLSPRRGERA
jgi:hypothetical protein